MKFGTAFWIKETENGKWAIITSPFNLGDTKLEDLEPEQIEDIKIFPTEEEASAYRIELILKAI